MWVDRSKWRVLARALALLGVVAAGLATLVGSGGGAIGFPPCGPPLCSDEPPLVIRSVAVEPPAFTAQVGTPVRFTAVPTNLTGTLSYQWRRSTDGGASYVDIPGATSASYNLPPVNLADDQLRVLVTVMSSSGGSASASARLAVTASPGIVFEDPDFVPAQWLASPLPDPGQVPFAGSTQTETAGGNPGAYRVMTYAIPAGAGSARTFYAKPAATYSPAAQGAIYVLDYAEDCLVFNPADATSITMALTLEQGSRRYLWNVPESCTKGSWTASMGRASLGARDFTLVDGPVCGAGESCPDFSVSGLPIRFGYRRVAFGQGGTSVTHGIDNWRVTVWRR